MRNQGLVFYRDGSYLGDCAKLCWIVGALAVRRPEAEPWNSSGDWSAGIQQFSAVSGPGPGSVTRSAQGGSC